MVRKHKCIAGCGTYITWQFAICSRCEKTYGSSSEQWPEWLRFLWSDIQRERRQEKKRLAYEVSIDIELLTDNFPTDCDSDS